uniref:Uncharacterized protein n=1 Tax=Timema cristinae TaxID=61476 RepID=A0A7R9CXP6_TIMCR|nr:unnamed protein product [Timema cristinae]
MGISPGEGKGGEPVTLVMLAVGRNCGCWAPGAKRIEREEGASDLTTSLDSLLPPLIMPHTLSNIKGLGVDEVEGTTVVTAIGVKPPISVVMGTNPLCASVSDGGNMSTFPRAPMNLMPPGLGSTFLPLAPHSPPRLILGRGIPKKVNPPLLGEGVVSAELLRGSWAVLLC